VLHAQEHAAKVDVEDSIPLLFVVIRGRRRLPRFDARVVEGEVQTAEPLSGLREGRVDVLGTGDVTPDGKRPPALRFDQAGRLPVALLGHVGGDHARPFGGESRAAARPMPLAAPVTNATFPANFPV
jgi:hypothetical protein